MFLAAWALAAPLGQSLAPSDEVATQGSALIEPAPLARQSLVELTAVGGTLAAAARNWPAGSQEKATLLWLSPEGQVQWSWTEPWAHFSQLADAFAPAQGAGVYLAIEGPGPGVPGIPEIVGRVVRLDDGVVTWTHAVDFGAGLPELLCGAGDGSRLFYAGVHGAPRVTALDSDTGELLWSTPTAGTGPAIRLRGLVTDAAGQRVIQLLENDLTDNDRLEAFDGSSGELLWTRTVSSLVPETSRYSLCSSADGNQVFLGTYDLGTVGGFLVALDTANGAVQWVQNVGEGVLDLAFEPAQSRLILLTIERPAVQTWRTSVFSVRPANGLPFWSTPVSTVSPVSTPQPIHGRLAVEGGTGRLGLQLEEPREHGTTPITTTVAALDGEGALLWTASSTAPDASSDFEFGSGTTARGLLFVERDGASQLVSGRSVVLDDHQGQLAFAGRATVGGTLLWSESIGLGATGPAVVAGELVGGGSDWAQLSRAGGGQVRLTRAELGDGEPLWTAELGDDETPFAGPTSPTLRLSAPSLGDRWQACWVDESGAARWVGVDGQTGAELWSADLAGSILELATAPAAALALQSPLAPDPSPLRLRAADLEAGALLWTALYPADSSPVRAAGLVVDGAGGRALTLVTRPAPAAALELLSFDLGTGSPTAVSYPATQLGFLLADTLAPLALALTDDGGRALLLVAREDGPTAATPVVLAVERSSGTVLWQRTLPPCAGPLQGRQALVVDAAGQTVAVLVQHRDALGRTQGRVLGLEASTGELSFEQVLGAAQSSTTGLDLAVTEDGRIVLAGTGSPQAQGRLLGFDAANGAELFALAPPADAPALVRVAQVAATGEGLVAALDFGLGAPLEQVTLLRGEFDSLLAGPDSLATSATQDVAFLLQRSASSSAGHVYLLLGSASGTAPGLALGEHFLSLAPDAYFLALATAPNQPPFLSTFGFLDGLGHGRAEFQLPAQLPAALAGTVLHHAWVELDPQDLAVTHASAPRSLALVP
jgi:outer membrane protein assembly factor BamB